MPSFVNRGVKMFNKGDGPTLTRKRSEGRMKRYESSEDLRAWCDNIEERRRYMLELMAKPPSGAGGGGSDRYVPFATRIEILQMMKEDQAAGLKDKLNELERELAAYRNLKLTDEQRQALMGGDKKGKQDLGKGSTTVLYKRKDDGHSSGAESDSDSQDLRMVLADRDAQIQALKNQLDASGKADASSQLGPQLEKTKDELKSLQAQYDELKRKSGNCDDILAERDALRMRVKDFEKADDEMEKIRYRAKEADVLRMERDRLKERVDELATCETAYMKLIQETAGYEQMAAEMELYKTKYEELAGSNENIEELKQLQGIEEERGYLLRELNELRCTIADQEDEIQRLLIMVEKLSAGNNDKEESIKMKKQSERVTELEAQLANMPSLEEEIRNLRNQLKNTIGTVGQDKDEQSKSKPCNKLEESGKMLEHARQEVSAQLAALHQENDSLRSQIQELLSELEGLKNKAAKEEEESKKRKADLVGNVPLDAGAELNGLRNKCKACKGLEDENDKLKIELDSLQKILGKLEENSVLLDIGTEVDGLRKKCKPCKGLEDENEKLKSELDNLQKKLGKLEEDNVHIEGDGKELADSRKEIEDLRKEVARLEAEIDRLNRGKNESGGMPLSLMEGEGSSSDKLIAILNKILATGIQSLTFEELSFLHECICVASGKKILSNPDLKLSIMSPELHGMDKKELCSRIKILEEELTRRDKETDHKACCLEKCIMNERRHLAGVRQTLTYEQGRCAEPGLQHGVMKKETVNFADKARRAMNELEKERAKCRVIESEIKKLNVTNMALQTLLDASHQPSGARDAYALEGSQVPTRQPAPSRKPGHRRHVTYMDQLVQEPSPRPAHPSIPLHPVHPACTDRHPCPALCQVSAPTLTPSPGRPQYKVPLQHGEKAARKLCQTTCVAANSNNELQMITQRDTFMSACSARLVKKPKKGSNRTPCEDT